MAHALGSSGSASLLQVTDGIDDGAEPNMDELLQDAEHAFGEIFSVQAPRDIFAGIWSAAQCILSGAFLGLAGFIMQPIEGMRDSGVSGCFKGVVLGLCTGVFFYPHWPLHGYIPSRSWRMGDTKGCVHGHPGKTMGQSSRQMGRACGLLSASGGF